MTTRSARSGPLALRSSLTAGLLFGVGLAAFVDETVFHQLLHWHHFYDRSTPQAALVSDGLFHAFGWFGTVAGLYLLADRRRVDRFSPARWWAGVLLGAGAFQLYDGTVQHKLMRLHQIRYHVRILPYDVVWNLTAVLMLAAGAWLLHRHAAGHRHR